MKWYLERSKFAAKQEPSILPVEVNRHQTPLIRQLKNVDMWMQTNKVINLKLALQKVNGIVIRPGETFSYWKLIGRPSRRKGYVEGMVLFYGSFRSGIGGGLCQLSNLIYWITLHTPLEVTERHRHSYDVFPDSNRNQPFGSGATCAYNYLDLQIYNPTDQPYQLNVYLTDDHLVGSWNTTMESKFNYEIYEKEHSMTQQSGGGYVRQNLIFRRVFNVEGELVDDQYVTENYALMMYPPFLKQGNA